MPRVQWTKNGMKYSICFLPLVGAVTGAAQYLLFLALGWLGAGQVMKTCVFAGVPLIITGGIHMDGYLDTSDAIHSWKTREEKLDILKDPHVGAFAVISGILYAVLQIGFVSELMRHGSGQSPIAVISAGYILSRAFSGLAVVTFPKAKKDGMLRTASDASPSSVKWIMTAEAAAAACLMIIISPAFGTAAVIACSIMFIIYYKMAIKIFGGTTGDIAGWFLQMAELAMPAAVVIVLLISSRI